MGVAPIINVTDLVILDPISCYFQLVAKFLYSRVAAFGRSPKCPKHAATLVLSSWKNRCANDLINRHKLTPSSTVRQPSRLALSSPFIPPLRKIKGWVELPLLI